MKWRKYFVVISLMPISLCGCVTTLITEKAASVAAPPKIEHFNFDLSTPGMDGGKLAVHCRQPSYQASVAKYAIKVDSNPALVVAKNSDTEIRIDAGKHTVKFYAVSDNVGESEKVSFGRATTKDIHISKDAAQDLTYIGPYRLFGEGKLEIAP